MHTYEWKITPEGERLDGRGFNSWRTAVARHPSGCEMQKIKGRKTGEVPVERDQAMPRRAGERRKVGIGPLSRRELIAARPSPIRDSHSSGSAENTTSGRSRNAR